MDMLKYKYPVPEPEPAPEILNQPITKADTTSSLRLARVALQHLLPLFT
jgi:hypothetical protein